jgi:hypothetical protein
LTAFAFAPGVLNTGIPSSEHSSTGILFTPAPALAIALRLLPKSSFLSLWLLKMIASGSERPSDTSNFFLGEYLSLSQQ